MTRGAHDLAADRAGRSPYARWPALAVAWGGVAFGGRRRGNSRRMGQVLFSALMSDRAEQREIKIHK